MLIYINVTDTKGYLPGKYITPLGSEGHKMIYNLPKREEFKYRRGKVNNRKVNMPYVIIYLRGGNVEMSMETRAI